MEINNLDAQILIEAYTASAVKIQDGIATLEVILAQPVYTIFPDLTSTREETAAVLASENAALAEIYTRIEALKDVRGW